MAAAMRPVPMTTVPVLVARLEDGTELMMADARSAGGWRSEDMFRLYEIQIECSVQEEKTLRVEKKRTKR